ncbi:MAG: Thioredoxin [uncultured Campylobacterales bacterium]|uniref:Thioredoxin n=1 Tax=uncultured Campylobacterales bacterium TaxID=352960 RepID=A0A6S6T7I4_9BACT|nr:MAG: Thioredoxin [uncultured Campylobacterales bacterium]
MKKICLTLIIITSILFSSNLEFNLKDVKNNEINIAVNKNGIKFKEFENKVILLDFFGLACPPCIASIPKLVSIQKNYKNSFEIVGVEVQNKLTIKQLKLFFKKFKINYTIINSKKADSLVSFISQITKWEGGIPFMLLIDTKGQIRTIYRGIVNKTELSNDIEQLLKQKSI